MQLTINKALVMGKTIRERINDLKTLRQGVTTKRTLFTEQREVTEPTYDIRELDKRILNLQKIAFQLESAIKEQNNITFVYMPEGIEDELFKSIE